MQNQPILLATLLLAAVGCGERATDGGHGGHVSVKALPLTLPDLIDAEYFIAVDNADGDRVFEVHVTSTQYGDSHGAVTYVGPCDASSNPNRVSLVLERMVVDVDGSPHELGPDELANPAPSDRPLVKSVTCEPNADVSVPFNLVVQRNAQQGFFDVAVSFDDVFCSAKVDCAYPTGPITLLHDPRTGKRGPTMVMALACTTGNDSPSWLYLSELELDCGDEVIHLDPSRPVTGNQGARLPSIFQWGLYRGVEFTQASVDFDKCYTTVAIGLDTDYLAGRTCTLRAIGTAASSLWGDGHVPADTTYPVVAVEVPVTANGDQLVCNPANNALDADGSGVRTRYLRPDEARDTRFGYALDCATGEVETPGGLACSGLVPGSDAMVAVRQADGGVQIEVDGVASSVYALPSNVGGRAVQIGDSCCVDPCCAN